MTIKCLILYPYPPESDGVSLQGHYLYLGLKELGVDAIPCHFKDSMQKEYYLKYLKPDFVLGIGFWGNVPEIVQEPLKYGITPVPWFNADGWVANYQKEFNELKLMFTTSAWVKSVYERDGVDVSKIISMHIGIDTELFKPKEDGERKNIREMLGIKENEKLIMTIGGDVTSKGAQEMIRALAEVDKEFKDWKYICKSWPSECADMWREKEMELVEELNLQDKVIFIDDVFSSEFMVDMLNSCDIYAAPSRLEGFGMIQVEAMACGKPVISIDKMGPAETMVHGKTGFLAKSSEEVVLNEEWGYQSMGFEEDKIIKFDKPKVFGYRADVNELKEYTLKLLRDDKLREEMGKEGRKHVVKNFDYRVIAKKMLDIIKEKLGLENEGNNKNK